MLVLSILVNDHTKYMVAERYRESGSVIKGMEITISLHLPNYTTNLKLNGHICD